MQIIKFSELLNYLQINYIQLLNNYQQDFQLNQITSSLQPELLMKNTVASILSQVLTKSSNRYSCPLSPQLSDRHHGQQKYFKNQINKPKKRFNRTTNISGKSTETFYQHCQESSRKNIRRRDNITTSNKNKPKQNLSAGRPSLSQNIQQNTIKYKKPLVLNIQHKQNIQDIQSRQITVINNQVQSEEIIKQKFLSPKKHRFSLGNFYTEAESHSKPKMGIRKSILFQRKENTSNNKSQQSVLVRSPKKNAYQLSANKQNAQLRNISQKKLNTFSDYSNQNSNSKQENVTLLQLDLELKQKHIADLGVQKQNLHSRLQKINQCNLALQRQLIECKKQNAQKRSQIEQDNNFLKQELQRYKQQYYKLSQEYQNAYAELINVRKEKMQALQQIEILNQEKINRGIQNFREMCLKQTVNELKEDLDKSKTIIQRDMELVIYNLRLELTQQRSTNSRLQINNRMLELRCQQHERQMNNLMSTRSQCRKYKFLLKEVNIRCEHLKKQNEHIKKQIKRLSKGVGKKKKSETCERVLLRVPSSSQSLALSTSFEC